ncbi:MAG TPA: hypothetical protein DCP63_14175 [Bacteroidetes bacterium]|nr:hypothetical protein [Bacteroidota bacterium]
MMHKQYLELLHLSFLDELQEDEGQVLQKHLETCQACRDEERELKSFHSLLARRATAEPSEELLREARQELRVALRMERSKRWAWSDLLENIFSFATPQQRLALGGVASLAAGMLLGYAIFGPSSEVQSPVTGAVASLDAGASMRGETRVSNVRFMSLGGEEGQIEFSFQAVTPIRMRGSLNDPAVRRVLAQALLDEQNPGARMKTVSTFGSYVEHRKGADVEIKSALVQTLKTDVNVGVRREALRILQVFPMDQDIKQAFLHVLRHETNPSMRIDVINLLEKPLMEGQLPDPDILNALKEKMQSDENNYIRIRARNVYEEVQQ